MEPKFYNPFDKTIDEMKPLLPQLKTVKKSCLKPYVDNEQLIKYVCEKCSDDLMYSKCFFYETTHTDKWKDKLEEIKNDKTIKPPYIPKHPILERLCYNKIPLMDILEAEWKFYLLEKKDSDKKEFYKLKLQYPCYCANSYFKNIQHEKNPINCPYIKYCNFFNHNIQRILILDNIKGVNEDGTVITFNKNEKTENGYYKNSLFYLLKSKKEKSKNKIIDRERVLNKFDEKKLDNYRYNTYEKVYKQSLLEEKQNINILSFLLFKILNNENSEDLINSYIITHMINKNMIVTKEEINQKSKELNVKIKDIDKALEELLKMKLIFRNEKKQYFLNLPLTILKTIKNYLNNQKKVNENQLDEVCCKIEPIKIDLNLLKNYKKILKIDSFYPIFYEYLLTLKSKISRKELEKIVKQNQKSQVKLEKLLKIIKINENSKFNQKINEFKTNTYLISKIFTKLDREKNLKLLEKIKNVVLSGIKR